MQMLCLSDGSKVGFDPVQYELRLCWRKLSLNPFNRIGIIFTAIAGFTCRHNIPNYCAWTSRIVKGNKMVHISFCWPGLFKWDTAIGAFVIPPLQTDRPIITIKFMRQCKFPGLISMPTCQFHAARNFIKCAFFGIASVIFSFIRFVRLIIFLRDCDLLVAMFKMILFIVNGSSCSPSYPKRSIFCSFDIFLIVHRTLFSVFFAILREIFFTVSWVVMRISLMATLTRRAHTIWFVPFYPKLNKREIIGTFRTALEGKGDIKHSNLSQLPLENRRGPASRIAVVRRVIRPPQARLYYTMKGT